MTQNKSVLVILPISARNSPTAAAARDSSILTAQRCSLPHFPLFRRTARRCGTVYLPGSRRIPPGTSARRFETTNGIKHEEVGQVFSGPLPLTGVISTEGRVSWHDPAGVHIVLYWHADENGYQPLGIKMVKHQQPPEEKLNIEQDFKMLQAMRANKLNVHDKESGISILDEKDRVTEGRDEVKPSVGNDLTEGPASDAESLQDRQEGPLEPLQSLEMSLIESLQVLKEGQVMKPLQDLGENQLAEPLPGRLESSPERLQGLEAEPLELREDPRARQLEPSQRLEAGQLETPTGVDSRPLKSPQDLGTPLTEPMSDGALLKLVALTDPSGVPSGE
ncbi:hypothetical protein FJT64_009013 [Amphibalanus amphitrite]|uniref:Uncharacterized protein n=1 Tax=Amphibalanus amphitrite TaxID=1232801 RepID=A0A6A4VF83_AMPAM|nr:hypothetical protein FJT64_009013 [Amphibalanus amphitrite]